MPSIGSISGLCADYSKATYNGRPYDKIYERILSGKDFRFNEMMKRGGIPCELGHPTDFDPEGNPRTETDPTKVAVILTEIKKGGPQKLVASGKILDTPNGRIFKALSEFYNFGLSSRGSYEIDSENPYFESEGPDGWNQDSYVFKGYDLVLIPANVDSVISATEGVDSGKRKIAKVAREAIDVNLLAQASQVSEDEVNSALDKLFKVDKEAKVGEEVTVPEFKDKIDEVEGTVEESQPLEETEAPAGDETESPAEEDKTTTTLVANGEDVDRIKADLSKALDEIAVLKGEKEKDSLELSNRNAEVEKLTSDNEDLQSELEERIAESEELEEKFKLLQEMASKLISSYREAKKIFDGGKKSDEEDEEVEDTEKVELRSQVEGLESKLEESKRKEAEAMECLQREKRISSYYQTELKAAKESLVSNYSMAYGVSESLLKNSLGKNYKIKDIRSAAESLANQVQVPTMPIISAGKKRSTPTDSLMAQDEVEREILDLIKNN